VQNGRIKPVLQAVILFIFLKNDNPTAQIFTAVFGACYGGDHRHGI